MAKLVEERCVACRRDSPIVTENDIEQLYPLIPGWALNRVNAEVFSVYTPRNCVICFSNPVISISTLPLLLTLTS